MPRNLIVHPLVLRRVQVVRTTDVTPRMKRVTVTGELGSFTRDGITRPAFSTPAFDDHVKLIFASDGDLESVLPIQHADSIEWPPSDTRQGRDYTPRRFDPETGELDLDFVLHGQGPAVTWAHRAQIGDELWFAGPKSSTVVPDDADWSLLVGDETALPAIGRFFEERPVPGPIRALIVTADSAARQDLAVGPDDDVKWLTGDSADPNVYQAALTALPPLPGRPYVWAGGESRALLPVRRHASTQLNAPKSHTNITGYWHRRTRVETPSPVPWLAIRAALELGIVDAIASGTTLPALAASIGVVEGALEPLVAVLQDADVVRRSDNTIALGTLGSDLASDEHARERFTGTEGAEIMALTQLAPALRAGTPAWSRLYGTSAVDESAEELVEGAERLAFVITGLPALPVWSGEIAFSGPGAVVLADTICPDAPATIAETPAMLAQLEATSTRHDFRNGWSKHEVVAAALALSHRSDAESIEYLTRLREATSKLVVIDALELDALSPSVSEQALRIVAVTGTAPRSIADIHRIAALSGWRVADERPLGWGISYFQLDAVEEGP